ncbi:MAG: MBL fold metallo-hydrolase [Gammaproteobacteria bacterium]|nr:MBL fold metallo-hydrolase [Gammaproteobacteria bacterium]
MANPARALPENLEGNFFVDSTCINCGVSRHYAPDIFGDTGSHAFVKNQPQDEQQELAAMQALLACPVGSIGMRERRDLTAARESFPIELAKHIYLNGFNHRNSYGAHSYFINSKTGNWLIDSPRFVSDLVRKFEIMGGIKYIFLTHQDDVADAHRYARHFNAVRIIHKFDSDAQKDAEMILEGKSVHHISEGEIHFTPGHTRGHMVLLWRSKFLFSGDHYAWISSSNRFGSFRDACWYSWERQIESVKKMQAFKDVEWVLPGHGKWKQVEKGQFPKIVEDSVQWMHKVR